MGIRKVIFWFSLLFPVFVQASREFTPVGLDGWTSPKGVENISTTSIMSGKIKRTSKTGMEKINFYSHLNWPTGKEGRPLQMLKETRPRR